MLANMLDGWKNRGLLPHQVPAGEAGAFANGKGAKLYQIYQDRLKVLNACDFGDLLPEALRLFRENPDVLRLYQDRFRYMLVVEYQDAVSTRQVWMVSITASQAAFTLGNGQVAAEIASGMPDRRKVISVMMPKVPSEPTNRRVRS